MLFTAATTITETFLKKKQARERYEENEKDGTMTIQVSTADGSGDVTVPGFPWLLFLPLIIGIAIVEIALGAFAVYLSWTSNTLIEWGAFAKVVFAFFAFINGLGYLITHLFNKLDLIMYVRSMRQSMAQMPLPPPAVYGGGRLLRGGRKATR